MQTFIVMYASALLVILVYCMFRNIRNAKKKNQYYQYGYELALRGISIVEAVAMNGFHVIKKQEDKEAFKKGWSDGFNFMSRED